MEIKGLVKVVGDELTVSPSYTKRELVITTEEQYPQSIMIEFPQGKCNTQLDQLTPGERVTVSINIGGREWVNPQGETKYFNSIKGWKVSVDTTPQAAAPAAAAPVSTPTPAATGAAPTIEETGDDLLF